MLIIKKENKFLNIMIRMINNINIVLSIKIKNLSNNQINFLNHFLLLYTNILSSSKTSHDINHLFLERGLSCEKIKKM